MYVVDFKYHEYWNHKNINQLILTKHIAIENLSNGTRHLYQDDQLSAQMPVLDFNETHCD